ncbi:DUF1707 SHOCT-like domain-containing protein [Flindersiella endophytica]
MSQLPEPIDPRNVRASDTDRHQVADRLRDAAAEGRLTLDELEERLEGVYGAKTYAELEPYTHDLPAQNTSGSPGPAGTLQRVGGTPAHAVSVAIMGGASRKGAWVVPPAYTAIAFWGGVELDLRDAKFAQQEVVIRAFAVMGGVSITVPEDVDVLVNGVGIMGGFEGSGAETSIPSGNRPIVRVTGFAFWGGVDVKRKPPKGQKRSKHPKLHGDNDRPELES